MYKFTNGLVFFDKESADKCIKAGFKLVDIINKKTKEIGAKPIKIEEEIDENSVDNESINEIDTELKKQPRKSKK